VEDSQRSIEIPMDLHIGPDVVAAVSIRRDLEDYPLEGHAVVSIDCPFEVFTKDVIDISPYPGNEGGPFFKCRLLKLGVEGREVDVGQVSIRLVYAGDAVKG
jgi:hypothetical protein